jgi:RNA polymerase sigma factor (sigma-70 family)
MNPADDHTRLHRYATLHCEDSFRQLVARHLDLVYSAALRQTRSGHLAGEAAQSVFIELSRSAARIRPDLPLTAWLYTVTRRKSIDLIRRESTRQTREQLAASDPALASPSTQSPTTDDSAAWSRLTETLDDAMISLGETDRTALLLRFFANRPLRDIGTQLGISEDAAQKRIARALDRLRANFTRRGFALGTGTLATALSAHAVQTAPLALGATVSTAALLAPPTALTGLAALLAMTTAQKTAIGTLLTLTLGCALYEAHLLTNQRAEISVLRTELATAQSKQAAAEKELAESDTTLAKADDVLHSLANGPDAALNAELRAWVQRVHDLKSWTTKLPQYTIPEMALLTESDWLEAARKASLSSESGARSALNTLRSIAKNIFVPRLQKALQDYRLAHNGGFPTEPSQLAPYFSPAVDPAILARYEMVPENSPSGKKQHQAIVEKAVVDEDQDTLFDVQRYGGFGSRGMSKSSENINAAIKAYQKANSGSRPTNTAQLLPYFQTPPPTDVLRKLDEVLLLQDK